MPVNYEQWTKWESLVRWYIYNNVGIQLRIVTQFPWFVIKGDQKGKTGELYIHSHTGVSGELWQVSCTYTGVSGEVRQVSCTYTSVSGEFWQVSCIYIQVSLTVQWSYAFCGTVLHSCKVWHLCLSMPLQVTCVEVACVAITLIISNYFTLYNSTATCTLIFKGRIKW